MEEDTLRTALLTYFDELKARVSTESGDWTVKGFIDIYRRIYTVSIDTKVLSKVLELLMFPVLVRFAKDNDYRIILARAQNHYPDISLVSSDGAQCYAIDIKSTYRTSSDRQGNRRVSGMPLGTFGGYFRNREQVISNTLPYSRYDKHYVLGVIYSRVADIDERDVYDISEIDRIPSVATDFEFFFHEKYLIASDGPGSGNTKNIGSTKYLERLINGTGVFSNLGIEVFDDYWMNYRTREMARADGLDDQPYSNLKEYRDFKQRGTGILNISPSAIVSEAEETTDTEETDGDLDQEA